MSGESEMIHEERLREKADDTRALTRQGRGGEMRRDRQSRGQ